MEQEQARRHLTDAFKMTGELFFKLLYLAITKSVEGYQYYLERKTAAIRGEQSWEDFLASPDAKELKTFLKNELNLATLTQYLKDYGIDFALREKGEDKVQLLFKQKDTALLTQIFDDVIKDLTQPTKGQRLNRYLLKSPKNMTPEEKLAYHAKQVKEKVALKASPKKAESLEVSKS